MIKLCFVCLGNICRSPTAEGVMQNLIEQAGLAAQIAVDSAGTAAYHAGERADGRSRQKARERGIELRSIARKFARDDFERFDYVLAMDSDNYNDLAALCENPLSLQKLSLLRSFDAASPPGAAVPDPYYGGPDGFDEVFSICQAACQGLLEELKTRHGLS